MERRHDEDMSVGERLDVEKRESPGLPGYDLGWNFSLDDLAEEAGHLRWGRLSGRMRQPLRSTIWIDVCVR